MKTTALSASNKLLWDPVRALYVQATKEERVRQTLLRKMLLELGFPKALLAVEKELESLPSKHPRFIPKRRIDLIAYVKREEKLEPLLLIECKAALQEEGAFLQMMGYNEVILAPFLCFAWEKGVKTFWKKGGEVHSVPFLPSYQELCQF